MKEIMTGITTLLIWGIAIIIVAIPKIILLVIDGINMVINKVKDNK